MTPMTRTAFLAAARKYLDEDEVSISVIRTAITSWTSSNIASEPPSN
jgi:hypothetical protein